MTCLMKFKSKFSFNFGNFSSKMLECCCQDTQTATLVMTRHGESEFTAQNLFCGWYDADLTDRGREDAKNAGKLILENKFKFNIAFSSLLNRANETLDIILEHIEQKQIEVRKSWHLNERHYGDLTGFNKAEMAEKYGLEQIQIWRRSFDAMPPPMESSHKHYKSIYENPKYANVKDQIPKVESLKTTIKRITPFWTTDIEPQIRQGKTILIAVHGTILRALIKRIENLSSEEVRKVEIPIGLPFMYELDVNNLEVIVKRRYLADEEIVREAIERSASIGKKPNEI